MDKRLYEYNFFEKYLDFMRNHNSDYLGEGRIEIKKIR